MRKTSTRVAAIVLSLLSVVLLNSCRKNDTNSKGEVRKKFTADFNTFWRVNAFTSTPVTVDGVKYNEFGHLLGGGDGKATDLGNCKYYFNHHMYTDVLGKPVVGLLNAPVADVLVYPISTQYPAPRIQAGDFKDLTAADDKYRFPAYAQGKIINAVIFDGSENAVFTLVLSSKILSNSTIVEFEGKGVILGGRGKFNGSKGELD